MESNSERVERIARTEAAIAGYVAGAWFRHYEQMYYTDEGRCKCGDCGSDFWPFFDASPKVQEALRSDRSKYPGIGGVYYENQKPRCHECYIKWMDKVDERYEQRMKKETTNAK